MVGVPERPGYDDCRSWDVPAKAAPVRIVLAHGIVPGMAYTGPAASDEDGETPPGQLEPRLFRELAADYAALGHLHGRRQAVEDGVTLSYPGSARVWRRGESGERGVWRLAAGGNGVTSEFVPLRAAGRYRVSEVPVELSGSVDLAPLRPERWHRNDWVVLRATGVVEDENGLAGVLDGLRRRYTGAVRRLEIDARGCEAMPGIASQPLPGASWRSGRRASRVIRTSARHGCGRASSVCWRSGRSWRRPDDHPPATGPFRGIRGPRAGVRGRHAVRGAERERQDDDRRRAVRGAVQAPLQPYRRQTPGTPVRQRPAGVRGVRRGSDDRPRKTRSATCSRSDPAI